jgi:Ser/Thr protein kinase RdoA (MazF antagonist)
MGAPAAGIRPGLSREEAAELVARLYGIRGTASPLPADRDQNFRIDAGEKRFVLKIHQSAEDPAFLECQDRVMERLAEADLPYRFPRVVPALEGSRTVRVEGEGREAAESTGRESGGHLPVSHLARLVEWVPGTPLAHVPSRPPELETGVGRLLGAMDRALDGFRHPAAEWDFEWDLRCAGQVVDRYGDTVGEGTGEGAGKGAGERAELVRHFRALFRERVEPLAAELPLSVIHGDGNDHNVLVEGDEVTGLVDFGDLVSSWRVGEAAVGAAYTLLDRDDPLATMARVAAGYHENSPLTDDELRAFFPLTAMRLCVSVVHSARRAGERPDDPYLRVSEAPAWRALTRLADVDPDRAEAVVAEACRG